MASYVPNSNTPSVCVITARLRQTRHRTIKALPSFDKTDYSGLERELVSCLKQHYSLTHFADTEAAEWSLSATPFTTRMNPRGYPLIPSSQSAGFLSDSFSFGKDLKLLQQFMADNPHIERFVVNLFAKDPSQVKSDYLSELLRMLVPSKGVVFYFCRKATRKAFQKEYGSSLCGLLQFSIQKYSLESKDKRAVLDTQKMLTHLNSYLKARYLQSDDNYVQWTSEVRVLTFTKSKGDKLIGIRFKPVPIKAAEAALSEDFPSSVPIITDILPNSPAANCPCLWINDHLLCIKGYVYSEEGGKELEGVITKCTYVQIAVQRAVRTYGPERVAFIAGKRQKFGITFNGKKNLYQGKLCTMISAFSPRAESEYLEKGLELKSVITAINDRPLSDLPVTEAVSVLLQESLLQEQIKIRFCSLQRFSVGLKKDPGIGLALVASFGPVQKLVLNESPSLPLLGTSQAEDPLRSVFPSDAQHYDYLKVYILGVSLYEDVYELVGRLVNETRSPASSPLDLGDSCFQPPEFSPDLYPHCSLLGELFRSASSEERVLTELDLDADWRPVNYSSLLASVRYPDLSSRSPPHKKLGESPPHRKLDAAPSVSSLPEFGLRRPSSISLVTPSSSNSSLSSELAPDLLVRCSPPIGPLPRPAISLVMFRNTRELNTLSPPDLFPLFKRTGLYIMVVNLEKIFSFFENELHFYLKMLTELHSLPFPAPVKVLVVGLYDGLCDQTVRSLCRSLHWLLESLFNSHVVLDSKKFETCVFPIRRSDRNMDTVYVLRQTLFAFSRASSVTQETDFAGMLCVPDNFKRFKVCSLLQSTVPLLLSDQIGQILLETEVPDHQLEIALRALVECTPFCAPESLSDLSEEGLLLRPGIFLRILRQLERWSGGEGLDRTPEQREVCKQLRENCYFNLSVLVQAIMQSCCRMIQIARALLRWMEKLHFVFLIGGPVSLSDFEKLSQYKAMTPKPGTKTVKVFMPSITLWNDYKKVDTSTVFSDAHVFYLDVSDPISARFYFLLLAELLRMVHRSNVGCLSPTRGELVIPPLYDFNLFRGGTVARLFDQEMLGCNLEIINHLDQFQIEFRAKFGSTPSHALPNLLSRIYSCALRALTRMSLTDKGFAVAIGPACPVKGCPGKRKTAELSKATINFVQVINDLHPARTKGINFPEVNRGSLPCWGRPGVHVIDLSVHFRHPSKSVTHYSQCQDRILAPDTPNVCCQQHRVLRDWVAHDIPM